MRKGDKKALEQDEKAQSRMGLKNKLEYIGGGDFDLSVFTDSNNDPQRFSSMFPQFNEPTLEDSEPGQNLKLVEDSSLEQYYGEGLTARNSSNKSKINQSALLELELALDQLRHQLRIKQSELNKQRKTNELLQLQMNELQKQHERKQRKIQKQELQITILKEKQSTISEYSSKQSSECKSILSQSLNDFCPEMLSPEETVELLTQLLKKVSKSNRMTKTMMRDGVIRDLLGKMHRE